MLTDGRIQADAGEAMTDTQALLGKITALRQRLQQAQGLAQEAGSTAAALERIVNAGTDHDDAMDQIAHAAERKPEGPPPLPRQLTARARRLLERGRPLLDQLRQLSDTFSTDGMPNRADPLSAYYRSTAAMTDAALRTIPLFPDSPAAQLSLCEGLEAMLDVVGLRLRALNSGIERRTQEAATVARLASLLTALDAGDAVTSEEVAAIGEAVLADAHECGPLRFLDGDAARPAHFVACHSLNVARVVARIVRHDPELRSRPLDAVLAALLHDAGMVRTPAAILAHPGPLDDEQRRTIEGHCLTGAQLVSKLVPDAAWLADVAQTHHERLDGTGYPGGLREAQISSASRLIAVCDTYAAMCAARPHRPAWATRTALADTLLLADQGLLDRQHAERLLQLSFYPVGSVVEMASGAIGVVVAAPGSRRELTNPARPVVTLLLGADGAPVTEPRHLDLAECDGHSVVRTLAAQERTEALSRWYPEYC
jgi:HD-GYP domain-containing protein (c-di-GMP phosphodiesterase class II)